MLELKVLLKSEGHDVKLPAFDDYPDYSVLDILKHNRELIKWADEIYYCWNGHSPGTAFDLGIAFALDKPIHKWFINDKRLEDALG
jgi:nucleoside 2-deoxyribosyltransferase